MTDIKWVFFDIGSTLVDESIAYQNRIEKTIADTDIICDEFYRKMIGISKQNENHHNDWEHAADDFQRSADGGFDYSITEPEMIEIFCSSCWHYDKESSPNGGRRDICVEKTEKLIDLAKITVPTLVICGSNDPYLNFDLVNPSVGELPDGSELKIIDGGAHVIMYEKPYYKDFQNKLAEFLSRNDMKNIMS